MVEYVAHKGIKDDDWPSADAQELMNLGVQVRYGYRGSEKKYMEHLLMMFEKGEQFDDTSTLLWMYKQGMLRAVGKGKRTNLRLDQTIDLLHEFGFKVSGIAEELKRDGYSVNEDFVKKRLQRLRKREGDT